MKNLDKKINSKSGFTLLEILLVIALIAILAGIILVAVKPASRIRQANDTQRTTDTATILNAVYQYTIDNNGNLPADTDGEDIDNNNKILGTSSGDCSALTCPAVSTNSACIDLSDDVVDTGGYMVSIPINSGVGTNTYDTTNTGYYITQATNGVVTVGSCEDAADGEDIISAR